MITKKYVHIEPGKENRAIAGHYEVEEEWQLPLGDREVLCILGYACWDNTCCSAGDCRYVFVPGYIVRYKNETDSEGRFVSQVERIMEEEEQKKENDNRELLFPDVDNSPNRILHPVSP